MSTTFRVSDVRRTESLLRMPERPPLEVDGLPVEAMGASATAFLPAEGNAFMQAAHAAYALHYPLVLTPDAVWLCIAQGFARHVLASAERLRGKFGRDREAHRTPAGPRRL